MSTTRTYTRAHLLLVLAASLASALVFGAAPSLAVPVASKFTFASSFGWEVNKTTGGSVCTVASKNECQPGRESPEPGGFSFPVSVAVAPDGNVYVADQGNNRIQELTATGEFVLMFGWKVDKTTGANICTAASGDECEAGQAPPEGLPGQLFEPQDVAVDASTGNVYVLDYGYHRVDEFNNNGEFVLMLGGHVNATTGGDVCSEQEVEASGVKCQTGVEGTASGEFKPESQRGNLLAVGGPNDLLYVGDEGRVQEFRSDGEWVERIPTAGNVTALTVDAVGDLFVVEGGDVMHELHAGGEQFATVAVPPRQPVEHEVTIVGIALDPYGRLGMTLLEVNTGLGSAEPQGYAVLYSTAGARLSEVAPPAGEEEFHREGVAFAPSDELYVAVSAAPEVEVYAPALFPEVVTCPAREVGATSVVLCGSIDPNGLLTRGFFTYGLPAGARTPVVFEGEGEAFAPASARLEGLLPNETYRYRAVVEAEANGEQASASGEEESVHTITPTVSIPGVPAASFVGAQSAVLGASVNPEHASATYRFEYAPCMDAGQSLAECGALSSTEAQQSGVYGVVGVEQQASGLLPSTTYAFRLVASNAFEYEGKPEGGEATGAEGHFTTAAAPVVEAFTGSASGISATGAIVSGTVNPDGQPAAYSFELGVYNGAATRYGVVSSGSVGAVSAPVEESVALTGLQPGTTYAYRLLVHSGYGAATGAAMTFTTAGLPAVLSVPVVLAQLPVPNVAFPASTTPKTTPRKLTRAQQLTAALRACAKKTKSKRAVCRRQAREKYGPNAGRKKKRK